MALDVSAFCFCSKCREIVLAFVLVVIVLIVVLLRVFFVVVFVTPHHHAATVALRHEVVATRVLRIAKNRRIGSVARMVGQAFD